MQNISIFRGRRTSLLLTVSLRYFIPCIKRAIKELEWNVRRFGWSFDIVHRQEIAMFSYLTGSLDYAFSNHIFILGCIMRFVAEYIMQSGVHRPLVKDLSFVGVFSSFCFFFLFYRSFVAKFDGSYRKSRSLRTLREIVDTVANTGPGSKSG